MKKKIPNPLSRIILACIPISILAIMVMYSCKSSNSVRDIRASRGEDVGSSFSYSSKSPKEAMVKPLFMQSKRANIELPFQEKSKLGAGSATISEEVTYINPEKITEETQSNKTTSLSDVQQLSEVVITAKSRFTPERNGRVNVDFILRVPKEILSENWRVTLSPILLHNDSIIPLKDVILKGPAFYAKQKQDYKDYDEYLKSIIGKDQYDEVFFDKAGTDKDIRNRQNLYYEEYYKEWSKQMEYEKWKTEKSKFDATQLAKLSGYRQRFYNEYVRKAREQVIRDMAKGKDTLGLFDHYMKKFNKNAQSLVLDDEDFKINYMKLPAKFREAYEAGRTLDDIMNNVMTEADSIEIASNRYMFEAIAENEMKSSRKEEVEKELIPFPYEEGMRLDTIIETNKAFVYLYKQDHPVTVGLKKLRLTMDAHVDAMDRSRYVMPPADTISYYISSLAQLADTSLIFKRTKLHRDAYNRLAAYPKFAPDKFDFNLNYADNKAEINNVLNTYRAFTKDNMFVMDSIVIRVTTALDGPYDNNYTLSEKRAKSIKNYFVKSLSGEIKDAEDVIKIQFAGEDWNTLARQIQQRNDIMNKTQILGMLGSAIHPDETEKQIKKDFPDDYKTIRDFIYPLLSRADFEFNMHRPNMTEETMVDVQERPDYEKGLQLLQDREYWKALEILSDYPDYNTALCLICMGYNAKAKEVLDNLPETGNNEYLRTILSIRSGKDQEAIDHLMHACEMDPGKVYRAPLDPEVSGLIRKYNLEQRINGLATTVEDIIPENQ
ncbi:OmpA family protein [Dysgonomonas reticulitermitis]